MEGGLWESSRFFADLLSVSGDFLGDVVKVVGFWVVEPVRRHLSLLRGRGTC